MKTGTKKFISLLISLAVILTALPLAGVTAFAAVSGDFEYTILEDGTAEITYYNGKAESLDIPSKLDTYAVTSIGDYAFWGCESLTSVTIPDSVTYIGPDAFEDCESLTSVTIPDSVISIDISAFRYCDSLTSVTIPRSVTSIGDEAFAYCHNLAVINVDSNNKNYTSQDGVLFDKNKTELIQYPIGNERKTYDIPKGVTSIGYGAFESCESLTSITIPNSVTSIGDYAFENCDGLTSITIPDSVTSIGEYAFWACDGLTSVTIGNGVTSIGDYAFAWCDSLTSITIPDSVTSIGDYAFEDCDGLTSVTIPNSVTSIGERAFWDCTNLTEIKVDASNKNYSSQDGVLFDKNKTVIIQYPIGNTRASYDIPNSVTSIGDYAFAWCDSLTSVTIPESVTSIGWYAFEGCHSLTSITIPDSVTSIEYGAFHDCEKLTDVYILNKECDINDNYDNWTIPSYITIHGYAGSTAEEYANKYGNKFVLICDHLNIEKVPAKAATCTEDGNIEYYHCSACNKNFKDINGKEEVTDVVVKATGHNMTQVPAKAATCTEDGNIEYYHCPDCNKNFKDKDGKEEVTDVAVKATGHKYEDGVCTVCGEKDPDTPKPTGEVSGDGKLSTVDAKWILQNIAKSREFSDEQFRAADLNGDGKLSVVDVKWVLQIVAGMRNAETLELITK